MTFSVVPLDAVLLVLHQILLLVWPRVTTITCFAQHQHQSDHYKKEFVTLWCCFLFLKKHVVREHPVKTEKNGRADSCTALGFSLIGIIRSMCTFGTYAGLISGCSLIVLGLSCVDAGPPEITTKRPPAWIVSKHRPFWLHKHPALKIGVSPLLLLVPEPRRATRRTSAHLMIKLPWSMDVPNLQILGGWIFPLDCNLCRKSLASNGGPQQSPRESCTRGGGLNQPTMCGGNLDWTTAREKESTSDLTQSPQRMMKRARITFWSLLFLFLSLHQLHSAVRAAQTLITCY